MSHRRPKAAGQLPLARGWRGAPRDPLELEIQTRIINTLKTWGFEAERTPVSTHQERSGAWSTQGRKGQSDLRVLVPLPYPLWPMTVYLEVKRPGLGPKPHQALFLEGRRLINAAAAVVHSPAEALRVCQEAKAWALWLVAPWREPENWVGAGP